MLLEAESEDPGSFSGDERLARPSHRSARWKALLPALAVGLAVAACLSQRARRLAGVDRQLVQLQQMQPASFLLCDGMDSCGVQRLQPWRQSPASLASQVDPYLQGVPGIPPSVFAPVAQHWRSYPPSFQGAPVPLSSIASFVKQLLVSDPFGLGGQVPYVAFHDKGAGQVVAISQKQLAFIVANVIMGNNIAVGNGLSAAIHRCSARGAKAFVFSLLSLLAVLSQELASGAEGSTLVAAVPGPKSDSWKTRLESHMVVQTAIHKQLGAAAGGDFMAGGVQGQAMTDIAGTVVGGGASLCDLANSQDESLVQFYSEVLAFAFFAPAGKMLPVPWVLLGARRYMGELTGESAANGPLENRCGHIAQSDWLNQQIPKAKTQVMLGDDPKAVASSAFVAVASVCSGSAGGACPNAMAVNNDCDSQRRHAEMDVNHWYQAFEPTMYPQPIQQAITSVIRRVGTGPWGAGVWWGDSQQYFLTVLLGTSLLSHRPPLDYYIYDHFCENPANQCFVLGSAGCQQCIMQSQAKNVHWNRCGNAGIFDMLQRFAGKPAKHLYLALRNVGAPPAQVFDTLTSWRPSQVELAAPVDRTAPAQQPQAQAPVAEPGRQGSSTGGLQGGMVPAPVPAMEYPSPYPSPQPVLVPVTVPVAAPGGYAPAPAPAGRCLTLVHRRFCLPHFHLPHLR